MANHRLLRIGLQYPHYVPNNRAVHPELRFFRPNTANMPIVPKKPLRPRPPAAPTISKSCLESFIAYVAGECHLADNSVLAYRRDTKRFFQWLDRDPCAAKGPSRGRSRGFPSATWPITSAWLHEQKLGPSSIARHIASLKVFFRYLQLEGVLRGEPGGIARQPETLGACAQGAHAAQVDADLRDAQAGRSLLAA